MKLFISTFLALNAASMVATAKKDKDSSSTTATATTKSTTIISHDNCDANSLPAENTNISDLEHGTFYKMCPGTHSNGKTFEPLGQPRCGDGSPFAFYFTQPEQKTQEEDKIIIELSGGGACWDQMTCMMQSSMLKMPNFDFVLGKSCTEVGDPRLLCARTVGDTDFTEYNMVVIPYCTQDVHLGDAESNYGVQHAGAHNTYQTLQWVFNNFKDPSHIVLTGCSAGATPLPVVYRMVNEHYKARGKDVEVEVIADSPVYLTPPNFMDNSFENWNHETVMNLIGFDYDAHKDDEHYATSVLDYVLDHSDESDGFGMFSHNKDSVSYFYYRAMGGEGGSEAWWSDMDTSWSQLKDDHDNFDVFVADASGHCSMGLHTPSKQPDFEEWASDIIAHTSLTSVEQDTVVVTNSSDTTSNATVLTSNTTEPDESEAFDSNGENSTIESQMNVLSDNAATSEGSAGYTLIATTLFFQLMFSLLV